jgi:hypothetical protein
MGSLILLLLVLDRRAKVVARAKERERQQAVLAQHSQAEQERMRAYEQKREELRKRLKAEEAALQAKVGSLAGELQKKKLEALAERNRTAELKARLSALREVLAREQAGYEEQKLRSNSLSTKKRSALTEHEALARELLSLENALADVIAFRRRQAETYSLVPYLGKSGENRRPIYVECQADQIIVHPEHLIAKVASWDGTSPIQDLADKLAARLKANSDATKQKPYLLFLIRPQGIATYYRVLGSLGVQNIDSGYELIDSEWALDFGESEGSSPAQPWTKDPRTPAPTTLAGALPASPRLTAPARGVPQNGTEFAGNRGPNNGTNVSALKFGVAPSDSAKGQTVNGYGAGGVALSGRDGPIGSQGSPGTMPAQPGEITGRGPYGRESRQGYSSGSNSVVPRGVSAGSGGRGSAGGTGAGAREPGSLEDLLQAQDGPGRRSNGADASASARAGNAYRPSTPGTGVALPSPPVRGGEPGSNTGDSRVAFTELGQQGSGISQGQPKLLPLPGSNDPQGAPPQAAGAPLVGAAGSNGPATRDDGSNTGSDGFGPGQPGTAGSGTVGGTANGQSGSAGGTSAGLANLGSNGEPNTGPPVPASGGQPGNDVGGEVAASAPPGGAGAQSRTVNPAGQLGSGLAVDLDPGAAKPARAENADATVASTSRGASTGGSVGGQGLPMGDATGESVGRSGPPGPPDPLAHLAPRPKRAPAPAAFRLEGNRDLPIILECRADDVVMTVNDRHWQVADLERDPAARAALANAVQQWVDRRQATLREGQTPYRPLVRFRVKPDGLRTYYAAYPALEKLGLPMKRENVESQPPPAPHLRPE